MGKKYSINSAGRIVAEREIYSLGGLVVKGTIGGSVKDETQLSQEGECWLAKGDISNRPDIVIKDNAYVGEFTPGSNPVHTDGITEFSGNTLIPGNISIRCFVADTKNNVFIKDSFIGISMDVLFGVSSKCHPVEQGQYNKDAPKGTLFTSSTMKLDAANCVRNTATIRLGKNTYLYTPSGYNARVFWAYLDTTGQLAFSGETLAVSQALTKLDHPVYRLCMVFFAKSPTLTPAELEASGAKILGHISGSITQDIRPESVSGEYVIINSSLIAETDNFGLTASQLRFLAGGMYNTNMYTLTNRQDYKPYGTFHNVERLEYTKYLGDSYRTVVTRDRCVSAYDCPLLRLDDLSFNDTMIQLGDLTLRRCIVPKGVFRNDAVNGNTYEDLDFSYAVEDLGVNIAGYTNFLSSHREGLYRLDLSGGFTNGLVSHKGNLDSSGRLFPESKSIPLDGDIIESGSYSDAIGVPYENNKIAAINRVRTKVPIRTEGAVVPTVSSGYSIHHITYLDEELKTAHVVSSTGSFDTKYPYFVITFQKGDGTVPVPASEFIALNASLTQSDYTKVPEITGSAYVGAGCTVRGDVQLQGDPYVNRILDVNMWEWGSINEGLLLNGWEAAKNPSGGPTDVDRRRFKEVIPVEPGAKISCNSGYWFNCYVYAFDGTYLGTSNWSQSWTVTPGRAAFIGIILKKSEAVGGTSYIEDSDISLANVKYVRAFKKRRYITNEIDRTSPEDVLLTEDQWRVAAISTGSAYVGRVYDTLIASSTKYCILKRPINAGASWTVTLPEGTDNVYTPYNSSWDASTKLLGLGVKDNAALTGLELKKVSGENVTLKDVPAARFIVEFVPSPRIIALYDSPTIEINGTKVRMYDNSVLSKTLKVEGELILKDDAVARYDYGIGECLCGNGHSDALIKLP